MSWHPIILHFTTLSPPTCPTLLREARKRKTIRETTFAIRGNNKLARNINKKKRPFDCSNERSDKKEAATYSPALHCSTIGASGLNFSVRNGKRWDPTAITTWCIFLVYKFEVDRLTSYLFSCLLSCLSLLSYQATRLLVHLFTVNY